MRWTRILEGKKHSLSGIVLVPTGTEISLGLTSLENATWYIDDKPWKRLAKWSFFHNEWEFER